MTFTSSTYQLFSKRYNDNYEYDASEDASYTEDQSSYSPNNMNTNMRTSTSSTSTEEVEYSELAHTPSNYANTNDARTNSNSNSNSNYLTEFSFNKPVLHLRELCENGTYDWNLFVRYEINDTYIVYGHRSSKSYNKLRFKFLGRESLIAFFKHAFCRISSKLDVTMYNMRIDGDNYEGHYDYYINSISKSNELFGYDSLDINTKFLNDYLTILRYAWN
jgi:hypothetical protein